MLILGNGYDGVRTVPGVLSNGARTVLAESDDIVPEVLGKESADATPDVSSLKLDADLVSVGLVFSAGLMPDGLLFAFSACFFASASLILRRMTSMPFGSCDNTFVICE